MRTVRRWEEIHADERPFCFKGLPAAATAPSSFPLWPDLPSPLNIQTGRIYYQDGWTALTLWNRDIYFVDQTLTFDDIIELIRSRFDLQVMIRRDYPE